MKKTALRSLCCAAFLGGTLAAQSSELLQNIDHVLGRGDRAPTVDEILGDTLDRIRGLDALSARAAAARLRETERELALLETLLKQVKGGLLVDVPKIGPAQAPVSPESVALERKKVEQLTKQLKDVEADVKASAESRPKGPASEKRASRISDALLDVLVEVPRAPEGGRGGAAPALDPSGLARALFQAGDFAGTLDALGQIPDDKMTPEHRYRRARALDQLGRVTEARGAYEAVVASDKDGAFGRQAAWMLKLARTREQVAGALGKSEARPREEKKP